MRKPRSTPEERKARRLRDGFANEAEDTFATLARSQGWQVAKRGWPDFWCVTPEGRFVVVEVKPNRRCGPKIHQHLVLEHLSKMGIDVYVWNPDEGLKRYRS